MQAFVCSIALCAAAWTCGAAASSLAMSTEEMTRMYEQLDQLDSAELADMLVKAEACARQRDFACADRQLAAAARRANNSGDRALLAKAQQRIAAERTLDDRPPRLLPAVPSSGNNNPVAAGGLSHAGVYAVNFGGLAVAFLVNGDGSISQCAEPISWFQSCTGQVGPDGTLMVRLHGSDGFENFIVKARISPEGDLSGTYTGVQDGRALNSTVRGARVMRPHGQR